MYEALKNVIPLVFDSTAQNIMDIVNYDTSGNLKKEIKSTLYETMIGVLDKAITMGDKSGNNTPNKSLLSQR